MEYKFQNTYTHQSSFLISYITLTREQLIFKFHTDIFLNQSLLTKFTSPGHTLNRQLMRSVHMFRINTTSVGAFKWNHLIKGGASFLLDQCCCLTTEPLLYWQCTIMVLSDTSLTCKDYTSSASANVVTEKSIHAMLMGHTWNCYIVHQQT